MKYEGKLNPSSIIYTTGMESLYENVSMNQREELRVSVCRAVLGGSNGHGICCVQHTP